MKSSKEKSAEEAYKKFLDIMLYDVPLKQLDDLVVNDVTGYGTTLDEKILEIERLRKLVIDQREQGAGYEMNFVINPVHRRINPDNGLAVFIDEIEISMNINGDKNIIPLRFSSVLELTNDSWKVVHLHGSVAVNTEGDTWHKEEHLRKIEELEKLVSEKTEDLLTKNRELEIEASLERVRTVAMGMNKSDDLLNICEVSFKEFKKIGFDNLRNAIIHILNDEKGFFLDYDYSDYLGGSINKINYNSHPVVEDYLRQIKKADDAFAKVVIEGTELGGWKEFRRSGGQVDDPKLDETQSLCYYLFSIGVGDIGISTFSPIDDTQIKILKRFRNVFDLAYRRYSDIALAEVQTREAQIELALERVRARTMAMQKSDELKDVIRVVYEQFVRLNILVEHSGFIMDYKVRDDMHIWLADQHEVPFQVTIPYFDSPHWNSFIEAKEKGMGFFANHLNFEEKNKFYRDLFKLFPVADDAKKYYLSCPGLAISTVLLENIGLYIENFSGIPYTDEENNTLMRFGKVFQQTFTRFLDLQKAEAQAREAQIELSLERIRAQVTAMRESSELLDIVVTMRSEFVALGHEAHYFWHMRWLPEKYEKAMTSGDGTRIGMVMTLPRHIHGDIKLVADWEKSDEPSVVLAMDVETAVNYVEKMITLGDFQQLDPQAPTLDDIRRIGGLTFVMARTTHGEIGFSLPGTVSDPPKDAVETLVRFASVFDLAYKRFEDLKVAERQHYEAQIELALERVRARTMAMQKSDELKEVVVNMFDGLKSLGVDPTVCNISLIDMKTCDSDVWSAHQTDTGLITYRVFISHFEHPFRKKLIDSFLNKISFSVHELSGDLKKSYIQYLIEHVDYSKVPDEVTKSNEKLVNIEEGIVLSAAYMKYGLLIVSRNLAISNDESDILQRFAKIFQQTYTRFLDLQKAEAQTREAQIETALERVRSRSMAMHKSEELADLSLELVKQVQVLGVATWFCAFNIYDDDPQGSLEWGSNGQGTFPRYRTPREGIFLRYYEAGQKGETLLINEIGEDECPAHYEYLCTLPGVGEQLLKMKAAGIPFPTSQIDHVAFFKYGYIIFITYEPVPEAHDIFKRFAKVFEQTYTRFLDLQKAEAQAREKEIELAVERVRANAMAMHNSSEVLDVVIALRKEIDTLRIPGILAATLYLKQDNGTIRLLDLTSYDKSENSKGFTLDFEYSLADAAPYFQRIWTISEPYFVLDGPVDEWKDTINWFEKVVSKEYAEFTKDYLSKLPAGQTWHAFVQMTQGLLCLDFTQKPPDETEIIMKKMGISLDLTFKRFYDLQKAEAQAREAQIQLALERVRARTMAMQKSDELPEAATLLFQQVQSLGMPAWSAGYCTWNEDKSAVTLWMSSEGVLQPPFSAPTTKDELFIEMRKGQEDGKAFHVVEMGGKKLVKHYQYMRSLPVVGEILDSIIEAGHPLPTFQIMHHAYFSKGFLLFITYEPVPDAHDIFKRFASVFDQTYTRFLDLQKAEAQARAAQIESALEKVRAVALSLKKSDEMLDIAEVLYQQLLELGFTNIRNAIIDIHNESNETFWDYDYSHDMGKTITLMTYHDDPIIEKQVRQIESSSDAFFELILEGQDLQDLIDMRLRNGENEDFRLRQIEQLTYNLYSFGNGAIGISNFGLLSDEQKIVLKRFRNVFAFAYKRYNDLVLAETQAREAQIELALERTRTQSMLMQHSSELNDISKIFHEQLLLLGIDSEFSFVWLPDESKQEHMFWATWISEINGVAQYQSKAINYPLDKTEPGTAACYVDWESGQPVHETYVQPDQIVSFFATWEELLRGAEQFKPELFPEGIYYTEAYMKYGCFGIDIRRKLSADEKEIIRRFSVEFERTYTRFLDLQKAEAQNRIIQAENDRKTKELEEARQLQLSLLPRTLPRLPQFDIAVYMKTATEVGGDYYDFKVQENGVLNIGIGDATGHGLQAGTMITLMKGFFTSDAAKFNPQKFLEHCNGMIREIKLGRILMSFSHLRFENNVLLISSAGMPPVYYHHKKNNRTEEIIIQGLPLGAMGSASYKLVEKEINSGDTILLLTDGLPEQMNSHNVIFDYSRVLKYFDEIADNSPQEIINRLVEKADGWMSGQKQSDDVTFVVIKVK